MWKRLWVAAGSLIALALITLTAAPLTADARQPAANPLQEIVAVGRGVRSIVLATPAQPLAAHRWRYRAIALRPEGARPMSVALSRSATKALVIFAGGAERVFDLTQKLDSVGAGETHTPQHRLPGQFFPVARAGKVCLMDDIGHLEADACRSASRAVVHEDGRVLYALADGRLGVTQPGTGELAALPYHIPSSATYQLLAGQQGDRHDFLVLIEQDHEVHIVDPTRAREVLRSYRNWEVATLGALLAFSSEEPSFDNGPLSGQVLRTLAANLVQDAPPDNYAWSFFRVRPEVPLYAPVLEFAPGEPAYPSDVGIWNILNAITHGHTREAYQEAYETLGEKRWRLCKVYFRESSYPGSWLLEYWYYYPFDEGKPHRHIHDAEHIFIEVDKLGGTVRSVLASDHGQFAPNNGYSTFVPGARPVELPLFAFAEFEKHAMCPDINHDGAFTPGVDVNLYREKYAVWGLRDLGGNKEHLMEPYRPSMSLPRTKEDRFALQEYARHFPDLEVSEEKATCGLLPFPDDPPCKECEAGSVESALAHLTAHSDARKPEEIYKPWVLPWRQVRVGLGLFDRAGSHTQLYAAYVSDLVHLTRGFVPVAGRLSLEAMWSPVSHRIFFSSDGQPSTGRVSSETFLGARYERLVTSTQGIYFGVTPHWGRFAAESVNGLSVLSQPCWRYDGLWYRTGYIFELPSRRKGNMTHHVGIVFQGKTVRFEWHVSLGLLRRRGRHSFGIRSSDPNPYQPAFPF